MKAINRIKEVADKAEEVSDHELEIGQAYEREDELTAKVAHQKQQIEELKMVCNYLRTEVYSLVKVTRELASIIDETHTPSNEKRINNLTEAYWKKIDDLQIQINKCVKV